MRRYPHRSADRGQQRNTEAEAALSSAKRSSKAQFAAWQNRTKAGVQSEPVEPLEANPSASELFRTRDVLQLLGISRRQLQYWAQTNLVKPSARTQGGHHRYSFEDLIALKAAKRLIDAGVSVQRIRTSIQTLREVLSTLALPARKLTLVATGDVLLVLGEATDIHTVRGKEWIFPVGEFCREVDAWRKLHEPRSVKREVSLHTNVDSLKKV
ncbi:MAG TPA: MerR family transcriptional regulator [Myxococcales bacterium]|nr:MerR family transcriptional regulator [Myxococcales bacterium]